MHVETGRRESVVRTRLEILVTLISCVGDNFHNKDSDWRYDREVSRDGKANAVLPPPECFKTRFSFYIKHKLCHDFFFWVFIICLALAFSCLKARTFSAVGFRKSFRWALSFFNSLFTSIVKPRYFREFIFKNAEFWNSVVRNLNQSICKLSHWILRQGLLIRQPRHTQSAEGHSVSPVEFPVFRNRFIISKRSF